LFIAHGELERARTLKKEVSVASMSREIKGHFSHNKSGAQIYTFERHYNCIHNELKMTSMELCPRFKLANVPPSFDKLIT
jgi:hypothetical protein